MLGIRNNSLSEKHRLCAWHKKKNFQKYASHLISSKLRKNASTQEKEVMSQKADIYNKITNLPYSENRYLFDRNISQILESEHITGALKLYIEDQIETKDKWCKCFISKSFTAGVFTTSRAESFNSAIKDKLTSSSRLTELLVAFDEIYKYTDKMEVSIVKKETGILAKLKLFEEMSRIYTEYVVLKVKEYALQSLDYSILNERDNEW